ncbi:hypothetical protein CGLAMM_11145 [Acetobacteraceae bacterium EV16G]
MPVERGLEILRGLRGRVTGLAWPTYVMDIAGGYGKVPLGPHYLEAGPAMLEGVTDPKGRHHKWPKQRFLTGLPTRAALPTAHARTPCFRRLAQTPREA